MHTVYINAISDAGVFSQDLALRKTIVANGYRLETMMASLYDAISQMMVHRWKSVYLFDSEGADTTEASGGEAEGTSNDAEAKLQLILCESLMIEPSEYHTDAPWVEYGADSLMAVELATKIKRSLGLSITQMEILNGMSTARLLGR